MDEHGYGWKVINADTSVQENYTGDTENLWSGVTEANVEHFWIKDSTETRTFKVDLTNGEFDIEGVTSTPVGVNPAGSFTLKWCRRNIPRTRINTRIEPCRCTYIFGYTQDGTDYLYSLQPELEQVTEVKGFI